MKHLLVEVIAARFLLKHLRMIVAEIFVGRDQKAAGAAGGIDDNVFRPRRHHLHHQRDDVARCAKLAVLPGARDLREHVFVEIALGVAIVHRQLGDEIDDLDQQRRRRDREARALHMRGVGSAGLGHAAQEREDVLGHDLEHRCRIVVLQPRPAHRLIGDAALLADAVLAVRKDAALDGLLEPVRLRLFQGLGVVQPAHEQKISNLLDHLERVGDATRPERVPHPIDFRTQLTRQHAVAVSPNQSAKVDGQLQIGKVEMWNTLGDAKWHGSSVCIKKHRLYECIKLCAPAFNFFTRVMPNPIMFNSLWWSDTSTAIVSRFASRVCEPIGRVGWLETKI